MSQSLSQEHIETLHQSTEDLERQLQILVRQRKELEQLTETLQELKKTFVGQEILIPLGAGIFAKGTLVDTENLFLHIGADVSVEKNADAVLQLIQKQDAELQIIEGSLHEELAHLRQQLHFVQLSQMHGTK